jgi:hypothetical protein
MTRPKTSVIGLATTATAVLFVITLSAGATFGATASSDKAPPASVIEAPVIPGPTPLVADPGVGAAAAASPDGPELNYTPVTPADGVQPDGKARPPHRRGYCRCSCGYSCQTSADCGGSSCDPFITCC